MRLKLAIIFIISAMPLAIAQKKQQTENVILITLDGFRWQELFNGADSSFIKQQKFLKDGQAKQKYWRDNVEERRKALLPFFWNTIAKQGQLYGNRPAGCKVNLTNNQLFSYPGYNEILTGKADNARINSNDKFYNPNVNVLEFLNQQKELKGKVAAFTSWDVFPYIINDKRSGVFVSTGAFPIGGTQLSEREKVLNELITAVPNPLGDVRLDAFTFYYGLEYMKKNKPRVMYFAFDETDDFAHAGEYAAYLNAANYTDRFIGELWRYVQSDDFYKNKTTLLITVDHGRGEDAESWKHHGDKVPVANQIWMAVLGPDTKALGEVKGDVQLYQNQVAATLAAFLGYEFKAESPLGNRINTMMASK
ncbi:MAG TPA: alkaline phosphatase family protein [Chryseosolibacter sp.]